MVGALSALALFGIPAVSAASSHREAPAISNDPAADNTDLYAWVEGSNLIVLANYIPLELPAGGPNFHKFSDEVLYEVHIARGIADLGDDLKYQIKFTSNAGPNVDPGDFNAQVGGGKEFFSQISGASQTYSVTKVEGGVSTVLVANAKVAPPNIGPRTTAIAYQAGNKSYEQFFVDDVASSVVTSLGAGQGRVFAGPRDDPFYVDLGAIFDLAGLRILPSIANNPAYSATQKTLVDEVAGFNTHTIALEIPLGVANGGAITAGPSDNNLIGVWASASRRKISLLRANGTTDSYGPWVQVSRIGLPLVNEALIGLQDKDRWNRLTPADDVPSFGSYFLSPVIVRDAEFAGLYDGSNPDGVLAGVAANLDTLKGKNGGRLDIISTINLDNIPSSGAHHLGLAQTGDVLRVDLGTTSGFPNGRPIAPGTNHEQADVTDVLLSLLLTGGAAPVPDGANHNDATFKAGFPFLASPWEGFSNPKGVAAP